MYVNALSNVLTFCNTLYIIIYYLKKLIHTLSEDVYYLNLEIFLEKKINLGFHTYSLHQIKIQYNNNDRFTLPVTKF